MAWNRSTDVSAQAIMSSNAVKRATSKNSFEASTFDLHKGVEEKHTGLPISVEQASNFIQELDVVELSTEIMLRPGVAFNLMKIPKGAFIHIDALIVKDLIATEETKVSFVDEVGNPINLDIGIPFFLPICSIESFKLNNIKTKPNPQDSTGQKVGLVMEANLVMEAKLFGLIPFQYTVAQEVAINRPSLIEGLAQLTAGEDSVTTEASKAPPKTDKPSLFDVRSMRYNLKFSLDAGSSLILNDGTSVRLSSHEDGGGTAGVEVAGYRDYVQATVTGTNVILTTSMFTTEASDLDLQITMNLMSGGLHTIAFNNSTLRGLQFKGADFTSPRIDSLDITANEYDFVITIDPNNSFTVQDMIDKISERIGNPALIEKFRRKFTESTSELQGSSEFSGPTELVIDSSQWSVIDYMTHGFKDVAGDVKNIPHIRKHLDDPAIQKLSRDGAIHLQSFVASKQLQYASIYDINKLKRTIELALSRRIYNVLKMIDPDGLKMLLKHLKFSKAELSSFPIDMHEKDTVKLQIVQKDNDGDAVMFRETISEQESRHLIDIDGQMKLEYILIRLGDKLNEHERTWLREAFVDAGGLESEGRVFALAANMIKELHAGIESDPSAPQTMRTILQGVPVGEDLDMKIAVGAVNIQGAIWASHGVLKDGWLPVSERLEARTRELYGQNFIGHGMDIFRESPGQAKDLDFVKARARFIGDGEEFFQQIYKLLEETESAFVNNPEECTIVLNHWAFEAIKGSKWALEVANRLHDVAMKGFHVSLVVDGKAGPSTRGQIILRELASSVRENGLGSFHVHSWLPREENFPTGTHVKYFVTPLGVIAGGSNIGDHYAHWTDTNVLLQGQEIVKIFRDHHFSILQEQRDIGRTIPEFPPLQPISDNSWNPLQIYQYHEKETSVFDSNWQEVDVRVFRDMGGDERDRILVENIVLIDSAKPGQTIYIINCYFIITQPLEGSVLWRVFQRALERGVNIEILTNTHSSIDVKATASPMHDAYYFAMKLARDISYNARKEGRKDTGKVIVHFPDKRYIPTTDEGYPEVLIHDKATFGGNVAIVMTTNFHPRSFTLEMELLTEMIGSEEPPQQGTDHSQFIDMARAFLTRVKEDYDGGKRIGDIEALLYPVDWHGVEPPEMWGPSAMLYLQFVEKSFKYCVTYSSDNIEDIKTIYSKIDDSTTSSLFDLGMNVV